MDAYEITTAWQAPENYSFEGDAEMFQVMVVGCGRNPSTHPGEAHCIPAGGKNGTDVNIPLHIAYTIDISSDQNPHRIGSFWVEDHIEDLPANSLKLIYFENLPNMPGIPGMDLFEGGNAFGAVRTAHRLLQPGGGLIIRTAANKSEEGHLYSVINSIFGNVGLNKSGEHINDIRARKH